ncbi:MAG: DUF616 domain-containing protein [Chitinophagales bacterium]|nr:DUF616 domain-containing protein [Chitinophagales bacterium]
MSQANIRIKQNGRIALYTAIFGPYDDLKPQPHIEEVDYICFTDQEIKNRQYKLINCPAFDKDPVRSSRYFKLLPHLFLPDYEISIWHDASIQFYSYDIISRLRQVLDKKSSLAVLGHPYRNCIYEEAKWCINNNKDAVPFIKKTVSILHKSEYPKHHGLAVCGLIARKHHDPVIIAFSNSWWTFYQQNSRRDQLSFNFIAWKKKLPFSYLPINIYENEYLNVCEHRV